MHARFAFLSRFVARALVMGTMTCIAMSPVAAAQDWPGKPVQVIVPFPVGGATDLLARILSQQLSQATGQSFVVENRAGANGNLGTAAVANARADGYTLLFAPTGPLVYNQFLYKDIQFNPVTSFAPVVKAADIPLVIAAHPSIPVKTLGELVDYAKAKPGVLTYSSAGNGSMGHLTAELLQRELGIQLTHVPYKGSAPALNDLLGGIVNLSFDLAPTYAQFIQNGRVNALAVTTAERTALLPEVATVAEQGVPDFSVTNWSGFVAPAGVEPRIIERINQIVNDYIGSPQGAQEIRKLGMQPASGSPADMARFIAREIEVWKPIAQSVSIY